MTSLMGRKPPFFWGVILLGFILGLFYVFGGVVVYRYGSVEKDFGWSYRSRSEGWYVAQVEAGGPAAGKLEQGDRLIEINGRVSDLDPFPKLTAIDAGESYTLTVERNAVLHRLDLMPVLRPEPSKLPMYLVIYFVGIVFLIAGSVVGLLRPDQNVCRHWCAATLCVAFFHLSSILKDAIPFLTPQELLLYTLCSLVLPLHFPLIYHFYYSFPPTIAKGRVWSFLAAILYSWCALIILGRRLQWFYKAGIWVNPVTLFAGHYSFSSLFVPFSFWFIAVSFSAILAVIIRNYRRVKEEDERRRIQWIVYGSIAGVLPYFIDEIQAAAFPDSPIPYFQHIKILATSIVPISVSYAVVKHRVFDIRVAIRLGLQYVLAKNVLRAVLLFPAIALAYAVVSNPNQTVVEIFSQNYSFLVWLAATVAGLKYREPLSEFVDRRFFREAYDQEKILTELIDKIKPLDSTSAISRLLSEELESAFHPKKIFIFYRESTKDDLALSYSSEEFQNLRIPANYSILKTMEKEQHAVELSAASRELPPEEGKWLEGLGVILMVPLHGTAEQLVGLLLLGERKSEQPYSRKDRRLLEGVADQVAIVCEVIRLKEKMAREQKAQSEVVARLEGNLVKECPDCGLCYDSTSLYCSVDYNELKLSLPVERTIGGKYRLEKLIGKGGMGAVYEATDLRLARRVAVKILIGSMFGDERALRRFEREARASGKLNHPNIITAYDYGETRSDGAYLVMELIHGTTLRNELSQSGVIAGDVAAVYFDQILEGIQAAHRKGIIHRDLKPENVLLSRNEKGERVVKLLDFGLAKIRMLDLIESSSLSMPGALVGTLRYMSPEQLLGKEVDERADIFALGTIAVEVLTGKHPFSRGTMAEIITAILESTFELSGDVVEIRQLNTVLQKCLSKNPEDRYRSAQEMQKDLISAMRNCPPFPKPDLPDNHAGAASTVAE